MAKITLVALVTLLEAFCAGINARFDSEINDLKALEFSSLLKDNWDENERPPVINKTTGQGVKGYLRSKAIKIIHDTDKDAFDRMFPNGIPVEYIEVSVEEQTRLLNDHGAYHNLEKAEVYQAVAQLFDAGLSRPQIAVQMGSQLNAFSDPDKIKKLQRDLIELGSDTQEKEKRLKAYHNGTVGTTLANMYNCPEEVVKAWYDYQLGKANAFNVTNGMFASLSKLHKEEREADNGVTKFTPGPKFRKKWKGICEKATEKAANADAPKPKRDDWNRQAIKTVVENYSSNMVQALLNKCGGVQGVDVSAVMPLDRIVSMLEMIMAHDPEGYEAVVEEINGIFQAAQELKEAGQDEQVA